MKKKPIDVVEGGSYTADDGERVIVTKVRAKGRGWAVDYDVPTIGDYATGYSATLGLERFRRVYQVNQKDTA